MAPKTKSDSGSDAPPLDPDTMEYEPWRRKARLWGKVVKMPKKDKGVKLYLKLQGRAEQAARLIDEDVLYSEEGFDEVLKVLDATFLPDLFDKSYDIFNLLLHFRKTPEMSMRNFLADFDHYYNSYANVNGTLDDKVLAWMVLSFCCLDRKDTQLVKAGMGNVFTYENTKITLKRLFVDEVKDKSTELQNPSGIFYNNHHQSGGVSTSQNEDEIFFSSRGRGQYRGRSRGRNQYRGSRSSRFSRIYEPYSRRDESYSRRDEPKPGYSTYKLEEYKKKRMNPICRRTGETSTCNFCNSKFHFKRQCGEFIRFSNDNVEKTERKDDVLNDYAYLVVLMSRSEEKQQDLVSECRGYSILDSGCPNTVCGENWMTSYIETLSVEDCKSVEIEVSEKSYTFGDGNNIKANRKMKIPVWIGGIRGTLSTDVVDSNIPLLLSVNVIEKSDMILHLRASKAYIKNRTIKLKKLITGHYALPLSL